MFGYVLINKPELKIKDYEKYQAYYCGLCRALKQTYGKLGQITLTFDMTFLAVLLSGLYEPETRKKKERCMLHPLHKHIVLENDILNYTADMNILMVYYKFLDDRLDDKSLKGYAGTAAYRRKAEKISDKYTRQSEVIRLALAELSECEKRKEENLDIVSGCFGRITEELFVYRQDEWEEPLRKIGFFLGKFIYLLDAYDDLEEDRKKEHYNPLLTIKKEDIGDYSRQILTVMMAECAREFERLPIINDVEILRNIIYSGVWMRYEQINLRKDKTHDI